MMEDFFMTTPSLPLIDTGFQDTHRTPSPSNSSSTDELLDPFYFNLLGTEDNAGFHADIDMDLFGEGELANFVHGEGLLDIEVNIGEPCGEGSLIGTETSSSSSSSNDGSNFPFSPPSTPPEVKVNVLSPLSVLSADISKIIPSFSSKRGRSASNDDTPEVHALKRHIRMIRNRESASNSRMKKKEYLTGLEKKVKQLEKENEELKKENVMLRGKLGMQVKKKNVGVVAKVALLGICGFLIVNFNSSTRHFGGGDLKQENGTSSSRAIMFQAPLALQHTSSRRNLSYATIDVDRKSPNVNSSSSTTYSATPTSYLNGTMYNQPNTTMSNKTRSRWRSRGIKSKYSSLKSTSSAFPPFVGNVGAKNGTKEGKCLYFNKTESLRLKNDLEGIFGRKKFEKKKGPLMAEPIVYSLISNSHNSIPLDETSLSKGLALYEEKKKYSNILEKLERREDTFYVVSLTSENQLLLSAKSSNESSRPKMTLLLPWRNGISISKKVE